MSALLACCSSQASGKTPGLMAADAIAAADLTRLDQGFVAVATRIYQSGTEAGGSPVTPPERGIGGNTAQRPAAGPGSPRSRCRCLRPFMVRQRADLRAETQVLPGSSSAQTKTRSSARSLILATLNRITELPLPRFRWVWPLMTVARSRISATDAPDRPSSSRSSTSSSTLF